jgi:hypothetical protein
MQLASAVLQDRKLCWTSDIHERLGRCLTDEGVKHNSERLSLSRAHACPILDKLLNSAPTTAAFQARQSGTANVVPRKMRRATRAAKLYRSSSGRAGSPPRSLEKIQRERGVFALNIRLQAL